MNAAPSVDDYISARVDPSEVGAGFDRRTAQSVKRYLGSFQSFVEHLHRDGGTGSGVNRIRSDGIDRLLRRLGRVSESLYYKSGGESGGAISLVAVGGYARREVSLHSDIDLLFLHREPLTSLASTVAERIQHWLWDAGVTVGSAVRSVAETIKLAKREITVATNVLDARFLAGDRSLYHDLLDSIRVDLLKDPRRFIRGQLEAMESRHAKFGESVYLLQPNLKEGAGGLRDYHTAYWIARATMPSMRGLEDLLHFGLLTEDEIESYQQALDFFWRTRNQLHLMAGRCVDQLNFEFQEEIAAAIGYENNGDGELPVEQFMRDNSSMYESQAPDALDACVSSPDERGVRRKNQSPPLAQFQRLF